MLFITPTERHLLRLLAQEKPLTEIAESLGIDAGEIHAYLTALFSIMGVASRREAVMRAAQHGLLIQDV
jgi:DNA-binding CsgD family transcriptional regulator